MILGKLSCMKDEIEDAVVKSENNSMKLIQILISQGRTEDVIKVTEDADYRHKLMKELVVL